jgi:hypothetical protein
MIIAYMGFDVLRGRQTVGQASPADEDTVAPSSLAPLIMFAAGPGTITAVVTLAAVHTPDGFPATLDSFAQSELPRRLVQLLQLGHVTPKIVSSRTPASNQNQSVCYSGVTPDVQRE